MNVFNGVKCAQVNIETLIASNLIDYVNIFYIKNDTITIRKKMLNVIVSKGKRIIIFKIQYCSIKLRRTKKCE